MLEVGTTLAGYRIERLAGRGGMGVVYRATQLTLERTVALKVIAPELAADEGFRDRFKRESRIAASIDHPNVIPVHEADEDNGLLYITMRYVEGLDLRDLIATEGRLEPSRAARIVLQIGAGLDAAHAEGLVHRDVKPGNVLITGPEGQEHVYLTDFGLTKRSASAGGLTKTGSWVGTLDYVAPEQLKGDSVDARADIYALGCLLYEALTGEVPYPSDDDLAKLWAHMHEPPPRVSETVPTLGERFDQVAKRAMEKSPDERFPSAGDLGRAALAAAEGRTVVEGERSVAADAARPRKQPRLISTPTERARRPLRMMAAAGLLVLVVAGALLALTDVLTGDQAVVNPAGAIVGEPIPVGKGAAGVVFGANAAWVTSREDGTVTRIAPQSGKPGNPIAVGPAPGKVA